MNRTRQTAASQPDAQTATWNRSPRARLAALALALSALMLLAACGAGGATSGATTAGSQPTSGATAATSMAGPTAPAATTAPAAAGSAAGAATTQAPTAGGIINMKINAKEAKQMLDSNKDAILLDVRTAEENRELRIPGSTLIPLGELQNRLGELPKDPKKPILIYCRSGNRSAQAAAILKQAGFPAVYDFGGIIDWPYQTEKG